MLEDAWSVEDHYGFSWWDSLIVAQAQRGGCTTLLTENLPHGQDVYGVRIVNPFLEEPGL